MVLDHTAFQHKTLKNLGLKKDGTYRVLDMLGIFYKRESLPHIVGGVRIDWGIISPNQISHADTVDLLFNLTAGQSAQLKKMETYLDLSFKIIGVTVYSSLNVNRTKIAIFGKNTTILEKNYQGENVCEWRFK